MKKLPRLLLIADRFTRPDVTHRIRMAVQRGVPWVQLRDHEASMDAIEFATGALLQDLYRINRDVLISMNSHLTRAEALNLPLHTGFHGVSTTEAVNVLGDDHLVGTSVHSRYEASDAFRDGAKYVTFSPVFTSPSHPEQKGWGTDMLAKVCQTIPEIPVIALGGITPERVADCMRAGAHGVAAHSGLLRNIEQTDTVSRYLAALEAC